MGDSSDVDIRTESSQPQRRRVDVAWNYVVQRNVSGRVCNFCTYCDKKIDGGGVYRVKQHLAGETGDVTACPKVPVLVRQKIKKLLQACSKPKKRIFGDLETETEGLDDSELLILEQETYNSSCGIRNSSSTNLGNHFEVQSSRMVQQTIKKLWASPEVIASAKLEVAKFFYDTAIPIYACKSPYFITMCKTVASLGDAFRIPSYHELRVTLLKLAKQELQLWVDGIRNEWKETGCTIMGDGWTDMSSCSLINFLIYCPSGTIFYKSVDASDQIKSGRLLFHLFCDVIEWVGAKNVVHMVTDNGSNYVLAGKLVEEHYPSIT